MIEIDSFAWLSYMRCYCVCVSPRSFDEAFDMRGHFIYITVISSILFLAAPMAPASAQCTAWPDQIANGQITDASQVMANFNALANCQISLHPGGATGGVQYNSGSGT